MLHWRYSKVIKAANIHIRTSSRTEDYSSFTTVKSTTQGIQFYSEKSIFRNLKLANSKIDLLYTLHLPLPPKEINRTPVRYEATS